jgi:hypothetical protein
MSEFDAVAGESTNGPDCSMGVLLRTLPKKRAESLAEAFGADLKKYPHVLVAKVIRGWGFNTSAAAVGHHRRGDCRCPRA